MITPGFITASVLTGVLLAITLALFIALPVKQPEGNILEENTFGSLELQREKNVK